MSRALKITFVVAIGAIVAIAIGSSVRAQEAATPGEGVCMRAAATSIVTVMRLENAVAALQAQIDKRKQEDEEAAKAKAP